MSARRPACLALVLAAAASACNGHVPLALAPERAAPLSERAAYYRRYRPVATAGLARVTLTPIGPSVMQTDIGHVVLADGTTVSDPEDLLQMVGPEAPLADSVRRADNAQQVARGVTWGGVAASVVGTLLMVTSLTGGAFAELGTPFWAGFGLAIGGSIATGVGRWGLSPSALSQREGVFHGLDGALRTRMALCGDSESVRDCDAPPVAPPAPPSSSPWAEPPPLALPPPPPPPPGPVMMSTHAR